MTRPSDALVGKLVAAALLSPCQKSKRGAVLVARDGAEYTGRNHLPVGACDGSERCRAECGLACVHAETEAILAAGEQARGADLYHLKVSTGAPAVSDAPKCTECSKLALTAGVARFWLLLDGGWRSWTAEEFHRATLRTRGMRCGDAIGDPWVEGPDWDGQRSWVCRHCGRERNPLIRRADDQHAPGCPEIRDGDGVAP